MVIIVNRSTKTQKMKISPSFINYALLAPQSIISIRFYKVFDGIQFWIFGYIVKYGTLQFLKMQKMDKTMFYFIDTSIRSNGHSRTIN